jgi:hypothetical protein
VRFEPYAPLTDSDVFFRSLIERVSAQGVAARALWLLPDVMINPINQPVGDLQAVLILHQHMGVAVNPNVR